MALIALATRGFGGGGGGPGPPGLLHCPGPENGRNNAIHNVADPLDGLPELLLSILLGHFIGLTSRALDSAPWFAHCSQTC